MDYREFINLPSYQEILEESLHQAIRYARYKEETNGTGKQTLDEIFVDTPEKAKSFYPLIEDTKAEYVLNIK